MGIGAVVTLGLLVAVVLVMFAVKLPIHLALWEALAPELKSPDPAIRRAARRNIIFVLVMAAVLLAWVVIYDPIKIPKHR